MKTPTWLATRVASGAFAQRVRAHAPALALLLAVLGVLRELWIHRGIPYSPHSDLIAQFLSIKVAGRRAIWQDGTLPTWDPAINAGSPALANPQSGFFNPLECGFWFLPLDVAAASYMILTTLLAGAAMGLLARQVTGNRSAALLCTLGYALCFRNLAMIYTGWTPNLAAFALVPLLPWSLARLFAAPTGSRAAVLAWVTGLLLVQGDMQQVYYAALGTSVYALVLLARSTAMQRPRCLGWTALGVSLGVLLAAPALLPRLEYASLSDRSVANLTFFLRFAPEPAELVRILDPQLQGGARSEFWENNFYFGLWLVPLWVSGLLAFPKRVGSLMVGALIGATLCFDTPLLRAAFAGFPGFGLFRQTPRLLFGVQLLLVLAGGLGLCALLSGTRCVHARRAAALAAWLLLPLVAWLSPNTFVEAPLLLGMLVLAATLTALAPLRSVSLTLLWCLLPVLDAEVRMAPLISVRPLAEVMPPSETLAQLQRAPGRGRTMIIGQQTLPFGMAGLYGIDTINGYSGIMVGAFVEYAHVLQFGVPPEANSPPTVWNDYRGIANPALLHALDVEHILAMGSLPLEQLGFEPVPGPPETERYVFYRGVVKEPLALWRSKQRLGSAYFASHLLAAPADERALLAQLASLPDPHVAYVEGLQRPVVMPPGGQSVSERMRGTGVYEYSVHTDHDAFLILSHPHYPGWEATLEGNSLALYRVNHALLGCSIPAGQHRLRLSQHSSWLLPGVLVAITAALVSVLLQVRSRGSMRV